MHILKKKNKVMLLNDIVCWQLKLFHDNEVYKNDAMR